MDVTQETQGSATSNPSNEGNERVQDAPPGSASSEPSDIAPSLAAMIAAIRSALVRNASPEARLAGVTACRSILVVLEAKPGQPLTTAPQTASPSSPIATLVSQPGFLSKLAAMSRDELLNLLKQVTGAISPQPRAPTTGAPRFHIISIPHVRRPGGRS
jgi:hypothetical protein